MTFFSGCIIILARDVSSACALGRKSERNLMNVQLVAVEYHEMNLLEYLYYLGMSAKRYVAVRKRKRLPCRVISIGNITVGGTGKTPAAIAVAEEAKKRGFLPVILTRGYKGTAKGPCFVSRGEGPLLSAVLAGDEPYLMAERLRGVLIVKGPDRFEAGMFALKAWEGKEVLSPSILRRVVYILDDGFQHWQLYRDRDIVLIDAGNPFGNRKLLPSGRLREPLSGLKRADVIAVTKSAREDSGLVTEIRKFNRHAPIFFPVHRAVSVTLPSGEKKPPAWLHGRKVFCFCGLADPVSFRNTVSAAGAEVSGMKMFPDHHFYAQKDIAVIAQECSGSGAEWAITSEKDMAKIRALDLPENILIIEIAFTVDRPFFDSVFADGV
jgi:tetraacyldisaccharide 4'-kinase